MANAQSKWWLPSAIAAVAGVIEIVAAIHFRSGTWVVFGAAWFGIAAIYYWRARP